MKRAPRRLLVAAVLLVAMLLTMALPAAAITGGEPDGDRHPNVGLILFYTEEGRFRCSATLMTPTVLLTAAHCTDGVVVLDDPVTGITPATLAPLNYLDQFAQPRLNKTLFDLVGYGTEVRKPESGPQKPEPMSYPLIRRYTTAPGQKLTLQLLQVNGNPNDVHGGGGSCFGDSGGPALLNGYVVAVASYVYTANCRYLDGYQRADIEVVQEWLATFGIVAAEA